MKSFDERTEEIMRRAESGVKTDGRRRIIRLGAIYGLCAALILAIGLTLFLPLDTGSNFAIKASSQYYGVAKVVDDLTRTPPKYKNNFQKLCAALSFSGCGSANGDDMANGGASGDASPNVPTSPGESYVETTDNQVEGVIEGDLLKRTKTHAFYYEPRARIIIAYAFNAGQLSEVGRISVDSKGHYLGGDGEIYLSADGKTLTLFTKSYDTNKGVQYACAIAFDVNSPAHMLEIKRFYSSGDYVSSRYTGGEFLLVSNYKVKRNPNFNNEYEYLPQVGGEGGVSSVPADKIVYSNDATNAAYTVVSKLGGDLSLKSSYAFLSYSEETYVSQNNIYLTSETASVPDKNTVDYYSTETTVTCLNYSDEGLTLAGSGNVYGTILNQYSMDEYDGNLRVVTEVNRRAGAGGTAYRGANLYSVSLTDFTTTPLLTEFCPSGESVQSVRFDRNKVYVCTAITHVELTDPVYAIDISDYSNVTYTDTGTIPGYSMSLRTFKDGALLGVGYGDTRFDLKISVYEEINGALKPIDFILKECEFATDYKAYFIDAERGLVGLAVTRYNTATYNYEYKYILVQYNGYSLEICEQAELFGDSNALTRAFFDDGYLYIVTPSGTASIKYL